MLPGHSGVFDPRGKPGRKMAYDDDDDWVGTPPEGHHTRDQAKPEYWREMWLQYRIKMAVLALLVAILIVAIILK
jgi:hypothetical protein